MWSVDYSVTKPLFLWKDTLLLNFFMSFFKCSENCKQKLVNQLASPQVYLTTAFGQGTSGVDSQNLLNPDLTHAAHHIRWFCSGCSLYWWTTVSLICLVRSLPLTTAVRQASTWERDLRTRLFLCVSTIHHSPPTTPLWVGMKKKGYLVPAKNWGLVVKLYDWRAPEHQQGKGRWTHWGNSTQPQQPASYTP